MRVDLLAGTAYRPAAMPDTRPTILVLDSGLGGLTVLSEAVKARPDARFVYAADDAAFPIGQMPEAMLVERVLTVMERLIEVFRPDMVVIACNTWSTVALPPLRKRFPIPFVGTVPAIKPAAQASRSGRITVLATPGTVARDYTRDLIETFAAGCAVNLVGSKRLASMAEAELAGTPVPDGDIVAELAPCFIEDGAGRTDVVVLACTHYPLLLPRLQALAPWTVTWIDPAPAIARRMAQLSGPPVLEAHDEGIQGVFTGGGGLTPALRKALAVRGLPHLHVEPVPFHKL